MMRRSDRVKTKAEETLVEIIVAALRDAQQMAPAGAYVHLSDKQ